MNKINFITLWISNLGTNDPTPVKLAYDVFEPVSDECESLSPVIFLHGLTGTKEHWMGIPQIIANKTKRKAYTIDARNHGDTEYTDDYNFDLNVDDLLHFMDTITVPKAILVGHSMGGITSIRAALRSPERVETVFCEDIYTKKLPNEVLGGIKEHVRLWTKSVEKVPKHSSPTEAIAFTIDYLCNTLAKDLPFVDEEIIRRVPMKLNHSPEGVYKVAYNDEVITKALNNPDTLMTETSGQFKGPSYFIYGSLSPFGVDKEEENIRKHFPSMKLIEFEGATHALHFEFPEKFTETLLKYLESK